MVADVFGRPAGQSDHASRKCNRSVRQLIRNVSSSMDLDQLFFKYCVYYPAVLGQGQNVPSCLKSLRRSQWSTKSELSALQNRKLDGLLTYARTEVPHYQKALRDVKDRA